MHYLNAISLLSTCALVAAAPSPIDAQKRSTNPYAPVSVLCPTTALVRPATSINTNEASYIKSRKAKADVSLATWLAKQGTFSTSSQPAVGLVSSGGGLRATLSTAGLVQAFDSRDSSLSTSGLYQALTYESGLSGGAWFMSSLAGNNWPTVSYLQKNYWNAGFQNTLLLPANLLSASGLTEYSSVLDDLVAKVAAGYPISLVDAYGRLLSYQLLSGTDGGVSTRLSGLTSLSNFTSFNVPYPVITALGVNGLEGQCSPPLNATQYEAHPYEFGSWDNGVSAFTQTKYLGSSLTNGKATLLDICTEQFDNLGFIMGTSSDVLYDVSDCVVPTATNSTNEIVNVLEGIVKIIQGIQDTDTLAVYPNPFYKYTRSSLVSSAKQLTLLDGGVANQNNPIWPFIQPYRNVSVLIVADNSADTTDNWPNGTEIHQTYVNAKAAGLTKMPYIPDVSTFLSEGLNKHANFFGCNSTGTNFIVWLPNTDYTYASNTSTFMIQYSVAQTTAMLANGQEIATQGGDSEWPFCLACAIKNADGTALPAGCNACFEKYCYYESGTTA